MKLIRHILYKGHSRKLHKDRVNNDVLTFSFANRKIEHQKKGSTECNSIPIN